MSTFLSSLLGKRSAKAPRSNVAVSIQGRDRDREQQPRIEHSSTILFLNKVYKGYTGTITKTFTPKVLVSFEEEIVQKSDFPDAKLGDLVKRNKYPFSFLVIDEYPHLYVVQTESGETYNLPKQYLNRILTFRHENDRGEEEYLTGILEKEEFLPEEGIVYHFLLEGDDRRTVKKTSLNISQEEWQIRGTGNPQLDGQKGKLLKVVPEQLVLSTSNHWFSPYNIIREGDGKVMIKKGDYANKRGKIVKEEPKSFEIVIDMSNKKIKKINQQIITERDIFYKDIKLKNNKFVQVISALNNGRFIVTDSRSQFEVGPSDIDSFGPGFKVHEDDLSTMMSKLNVANVAQEKDIETENNSFVQEPEPELEPEVDGDEEDLELEPEQEETEIESSSPTLVSSYKDIERIVKEREILTEDQMEIKKMTDSLFDYFVVNPQDVNTNELIKTIEEVKQVAIKKLKDKKYEDVFSKNDLKFLCVVVMFFYLVKKGDVKSSMSYFRNMILGKLMEKKYFKPIDVKNSSWFLMAPSQKTSFVGKVDEILATVIQLTKDVLGDIQEEVDYDYRMEAIPLRLPKEDVESESDSFLRSEYTSKSGTSVKYMGKPPLDYTRKPIREAKKLPRFADYKRNIEMTEDAQMLWTQSQEKIIRNMKNKLEEALTDNNYSSHHPLFRFAIDNLDNIYVVINNMEKEGQSGKYIQYLKQLADILTREFNKLETEQSMTKMKKSLQQTEYKQKKLAREEGLQPRKRKLSE